MECNNARVQGNLAVQFMASGATSGSRTDTLKRFGMTRIVLVYGVPVHMKVDFFLISTLSFTAEAQVSRTINVNLDETFHILTEYDREAGWNSHFEKVSTASNIDIGVLSGKAKVEFGIDVKPLIKVRFYSLVAPYIFLDSRVKLTGRATSPAMYWDFHGKTWVEPGVGLEVKIFGKRPAKDFGPLSWATDTLNYRTPFKIQKLNGDLQVSDDTLGFLPKPIKVKVLDELDYPQSNVVVKFKILNGTVTISDTMALTNEAGEAEIQWRIGSQLEQGLQASAYRGDSSEINGSPIEFTAIFGEKEELKVVRVFNQANTAAFSTNYFRTVGVGKGGYIYAGTINNGLYKYIDSNWYNSGYLPNNNISDIQTDQFGGVWIAQYGYNGAQATTGGINYIPDSSGTGFMYYGAILGNPTRNARGVFIDTTRVSGGTRPRVWTANMAHITAGVSTTGAIGLGLNESSPFFNKITNGVDISLQNGSIQCIGGNSLEVWAFASVNYGKSQILRYSSASGSFLGAYDYTNTSVAGMTSNFSARAIHFDMNGNRWIGLFSGGILVKEGDNWLNVNMPEILPTATSISTNGISSGKLGKVFFATSQGLVIYYGGDKLDPTSYKRITMVNGLPSNNVLDVVERASDGLLIVTTDSGIAFITGQ